MARDDLTSFALRVAAGATLGAAVGILLIGVGLIRGLVFLLGGGHIQAFTANDLRMLEFYVGGFSVGGALFGALRPLLRGKAGRYAGCMLVGVIVMFAIGLADKGNFRASDAFDWIVLPVLGMVFGGAAAQGWSEALE